MCICDLMIVDVECVNANGKMSAASSVCVSMMNDAESCVVCESMRGKNDVCVMRCMIMT